MASPFVFGIHRDGSPACYLSFLTFWLMLRPLIYYPRFEEFMIPSLDGFVDGDRDELLLCSISALRKYMSRTEQYCPGISNLFISMTEKKRQVS